VNGQDGKVAEPRKPEALPPQDQHPGIAAPVVSAPQDSALGPKSPPADGQQSTLLLPEPPKQPIVTIRKTEVSPVMEPRTTVPLGPIPEDPIPDPEVGETIVSIRKTELTSIDVAPEDHLCPNCGQRYREGELVCSRCGAALTQKGKTTKMPEEEGLKDRKNWPPGEVQAIEKKPITFEIGESQLTIFVSEILIVGRASDVPGDFTPDVDLNPFRGSELGVSRRHVRIRRRGSFIYVADLNSTNGTLLNGRRLIPEGERLLRSGDELRLGHLKMTIRF